MVGKRTWADGQDGGPRRALGRAQTEVPRKPAKPKAFRRYADVTDLIEEERQREELKDKLIAAVDRDDLEKYRVSDEELGKIENKKLRKFYEGQNERLNDWLEVDATVTALADDVLESFNPDPDSDGIPERAGALQNIGEDIEAFLPRNEQKKREREARSTKWAININVIANVLLLVAKIGAVISSSSLSLMASMVDSALDLLCTLIIWGTNALVRWRISALRSKFPVGRRRLEPLGTLVFSIIMVVSFLQILEEAIVKLSPWGEHVVAALSIAAVVSMVLTIVIKGIIGLAFMRMKTPQVQALVQDCKTDVFFNTFSLLFPAIGYQFDVWWLDPLGAALLSLFIIYDWCATCFGNVIRLSGSSVEDRTLQKIIFVAYRFESLVSGIKNVVAYHAGDGVWVEIDILLDPQEKLLRAHDIAETLQYCLEGLAEVDRAFVTVDYTSLGPSGHSTTLLY